MRRREIPYGDLRYRGSQEAAGTCRGTQHPGDHITSPTSASGISRSGSPFCRTIYSEGRSLPAGLHHGADRPVHEEQDCPGRGEGLGTWLTIG